MFFGVILLKKITIEAVYWIFKQFVGDTKRKRSMKKRLDFFMLSVILKFCTTKELFKYLQKMYIVIVTENLNKLLKN